MKLTLEQYKDKYSIETHLDGCSVNEVLSHMCNLMLCAGFNNESVKQAIYQKAEEYEEETSKSQDSTSELKQDKKRLDWLLKNCLIKELDLEWVHDSREAIDEAMEDECSDETSKSQDTAS